MKKYIIIIVVLFFLVNLIYWWNRYLNSGIVQVELVDKLEVKKISWHPRRFIHTKQDFYIYMKELSMGDSLREIADSLNIEDFDYIVSFNKILWCEYSSEFTESDGISADEDTRIPLDIKNLELKGDTLYIYKVCAPKGLYRQAF